MIEIGIIKDTPVNKIINIRDKNQVIKTKYAIGKDDILKYTLMNEHYIEISFELNRNASFKRSDYIEWEGDKYTLRDDYQPEQINKRKYKYTLKFEAVEMFFQDMQYWYLGQGLKESELRMTGNPEYFLKYAVENANRYFKTTEFNIGTVEPTEIKDITFEVNTNTFNALTQIADEYGAEWYITGKTIHLLNKVSFGDEVDFETEVSVLSMKREEGESTTRYTRILALGSTRNIPYDYRETTPNEAVDAVYPKRLRIPASKGDVIDAYPNMSPDEVVEGTVIFDEVYPRREGTIEAVGTIEYQDVNEDTGEVTKWNAYKIKDSGINFKKEYLLPGQELKLQFTSGDLNGRDFALIFHEKGFSSSDNSQFYEIVRTDEFGKLLPNDVMKPKAGDKYVLYGFNIALVSDQYVPAGELELYDVAVAWQQKQLRDTGVYECPTVIKHFMDNQMDLAIGQKVRLIKDIGTNRNLLNNSSFENGIGGSATVNGSTIARITGGYNGTYCMRAITPNNASSGYCWQTMPTTPGKEYTISCYVKADTPISGCKFGAYTSSWEHVKSKGVYIGTEWTRIDINFTATGTLMKMCILKANVTFYVDCVQLEAGNKATSWNLSPEDVEGTMRSSRIMGFEKKLNNKFDAIYTVGDNSTYSRFGKIEQQIKELQVAGIVYENTGGSGVYVIKQFDTTRPTDFNVYSAQASDAKYFNKQTGGTVQGDTTFAKNMQVQGTAISDVFQNSTFTAGQFGSGFQIKRDANGQSYMEVDNLLVRRETVFNRLTIAEIKSVGGTILLSLANMVLSKVEVKASTWKCFFDTADGTIPNDYAVGDQAICRKFTGKDIKYYWALVTAVGTDYIELSRTDKDGSGIPAIGDEVVQLGNRNDVNRQYAIMLSAYGSAAPSINQYAGINSYDLTGKEVTAISPKGNKFTGSFTVSTHGTTAPVYKERGVFANGTTYYLDDRVSYLGSYWVCIVNTTITTPSEGSPTWRKDTAGQTDIDKSVNQLRTEYKADFIILDTKIASKVSQTDFNALGQRVSTTESDITQLSNSITSVVETVNNIQVGGVNLLNNSSFESGIGGSSIVNSSSVTRITGGYHGSYCMKTVSSNNVSSGYCWQGLPTAVGKEYIVSCYVKADTPISGCNFGAYTSSWEHVKSKGVYIGTEWTRIDISFVATGTLMKMCILKANVTFYVDCVQLEEGNKATSWGLSQGDIDKAIQQAEEKATTAQNTATQAKTDATNAQSAASKAQTDANTANNLLTDIASDNKLTSNEKQETKKEWDTIVSEYPKNIAQANKFSVSTTAYTNAYNALTSYITPLLANLGTTSDINGATFRATFKAYYDARTDLLNAISTKAKELADAAQTTATDAQNTANLKNRTYSQDAVPTAPSGGHKVGDLWYKIALVDSSGNINADTSKNIYQLQYRWDGTTWRQINWSVSKSKIEQTDSSITMIVEKTGINSVGAGSSLYSMILQTEDKIVLEVSKVQIGGVNLLNNSSFENGIGGSTIVNSSSVTRITGGYHGSYCMKTISSNSVSSGYCWQGLPTVVGKEYIVSCYVKADTPISGCNFGAYTGSWEHVKSKGVYIGTEWTRIDISFVATGTLMKMCILKANVTFYVDCVQLEEGNKATSWDLSPADTQAQIDSKTTLNEVSSSLTITDNKISLASKTIELTGYTIAKSIEAQDLKVGSRTGLSALEVLKDGTFYAKGSTSSNSALIIDSGTQSIKITSPKSSTGDGSSSSYSSEITISSSSGSVETRNSNGVSMMSASGFYTNQAKINPFPASIGYTPIQASLAAMGRGSLNDDYGVIGVVGVYGEASNTGNAPAYGGYFSVLKASGLCLSVRQVNSSTTLNRTDCYVSCYNMAAITVYLPSSPYEGQVIYLRQMNSNGFTIHGNGKNIHTDGNTYPSVGNRAGRGDTTMLVYDGQYWNFNYMPR